MEMTKRGIPADLLAGALSWIEANLALFDPFTGDVRPDALRSKAFAELAFLCDYYRKARPRDVARVADILSFIWTVWQQPAYQDLVVRNPESLQLYVLTYDSLLHSGFPVESFAPVIQRVVDAGYAISVEAVPFRLMDFRHVLDYGRFSHTLPSMDALAARTMLAQRPALHYLTNADVYCLTHALFYLTDFGFASPVRLGSLDPDEVARIVVQLLGLYVRLRDWDLTAELLICQRCVGKGEELVGPAAWNGLIAAQLPDGSVPAPGFDRDGPAAQRDPATYAFEHNYHTTLVAALAAALCP